MTTPIAARDLIQGVLKAAWDADASAVTRLGVAIGYVPELRWPNVAVSGPPDTTKAWAEVLINEFEGVHSGMGSGTGNRLFTSRGLIIVEVHAPLNQGTEVAVQLATVARDAFDKASSSPVWYKNSRIADVGPDGSSFQVNVFSQYEYDERK